MTQRKEHPSIDPRDWRLQAITTLGAPHRDATGREFAPGTPVVLVNPMSFSGGMLWGPVASPPALLLSIASRLGAWADESIARLGKLGVNQRSNEWNIFEADEGAFFDALEDLIGCVVFSHTAIEAFANSLIPDDFTLEVERSDGRCIEVYTKDQIERHVSLDTKLDRVLPEVCHVKSPKGRKIWEDYFVMRDLRNRLVHLKSSDLKKVDYQNKAELSEYLWSLLLTSGVSDFPGKARALMLHFYPTEAPRWLRKCPAR
jgi:hypothetical protein